MEIGGCQASRRQWEQGCGHGGVCRAAVQLYFSADLKQRFVEVLYRFVEVLRRLCALAVFHAEVLALLVSLLLQSVRGRQC